MTDPVCGMQVDPARAAGMSQFQGKPYYFCSKGCTTTFDANPGQYVTAQGPPQTPFHSASDTRVPVARRALTALLAVVALVLAAARPAAGQVPVAYTDETIQLDGRLDEAFWQRAMPVALTQQSPRPGEATPFATTVRVVVNQDTVYIGFECADPNPSQLAIHSMQRDGDTDGDDFVAAALDTYGDRRTGYFFRVNAAGARVDGLIAGPEDPSLDWDGIWDARTQRTQDGWSAEIAIPSRTLNFTQGLDTWGVNFERNVARVRTVLRWTAPTLDSFFYDLSRSGALTGVGGLQQGLGLEFSPYLAGRLREDFREPGRVYLGSPGGDFTYRLTSQLAAVFTVNTDFAETEVDTRQLNLTRFELFFPERRTFFLEGSNQYQFGLGLDDQFLPFFSRRIGLFEGEQMPINAGAKINGRAGRWNIGILGVRTRDKALRNGSVVPGTNLLASRVSYDVTSKLRVGSMLTHGNPDGVHDNTLAGFDGLYRTSEFLGDKNLFVGVWTAVASGDVGQGDRTGYGFKIDYPNDRWDCFVSLGKFGESLDPALGFLPRAGIRRYGAACEFRPRPSRDGRHAWIRQHFIDHRYLRVVNQQGQVETQSFEWTPLNMQLDSGDLISFGWTPEYQYLPVPFAVADTVTLPVGEYLFHWMAATFASSPNRRLQFGNTSGFGSFYDGRLYQQRNYALYTSPRGATQAGVTVEQNFGRVTEGRFVQRLWQLNAAHAFSTYIALSSFLQYDSVTQDVGNNVRLRWTLTPGNDVFVVWNRGWKRLALRPGDVVLQPDTELFAVKLRWTFRR